jgi:L-amino acid N-acyltransferase YncA
MMQPLVKPKMVIRPSTEADVEMMLAIYSDHVSKGVGDLGTYDVEPLSGDDIKQRRKNMKNRRLPHLVAECENTVAGYAYAVPFRKRPAYRFTLKHSIYVHPAFVGSGVGGLLLPALIDACAAGGYRQLIGYIDAANAASLKLHESCGFREVGRLPSVAFKFGHWSDAVMVQRGLGPGDRELPGPLAAAKPAPTAAKPKPRKISGW